MVIKKSIKYHKRMLYDFKTIILKIIDPKYPIICFDEKQKADKR
jgi:hypothetical protein